MQKACQTALALIAVCTLSACSYFQFPGVYTLEVQQGNIIEQEMIDQLKPGMTKRQVRFVLGSPLVMDTFEQDRWDYYYSVRTRTGDFRKEQVTVYFEDDKLSHFTGDYKPSTPETESPEEETASEEEPSQSDEG